MVDQARVVQRQVAGQFLLQDGAQAGVVDAALGIECILQTLGRHRVAALGQVDGAGAEVDGEGDQPGDHEEQDADGVHGSDCRVDLALQLAAALGVEQGSAAAQLNEQGGGEQTADDPLGGTHASSP
ncbi:hypothetical protein D3C78_1675360 [compost metagenome]